ncbi:MAG: glycine--tRNA ligase subunit beta [Boseongicola sp.]
MPARADFLVEIGTEELPPKALRQLENSFASGIAEGIAAAALGTVTINSFATPRRLAVIAKSVALTQPKQRIEKRGPPVKVAFDADGNATRAALAFAQGFGVSVEDLGRVQSDKGEWLAYSADQPGQNTLSLLPEIVDQALAKIPIPKRMRWGTFDTEFVRPVQWVLMVLGDQIVPAEILGRISGNTTRGHRFHAPMPITIEAASEYVSALTQTGHVIPGFENRRDSVRQMAESAATDLGGSAILEPAVLDEVTALVEWPVAVTGRFDAKFLQLPAEVLISTLQDHQRYFPVRDSNGGLMPNFIAISNLASTDPELVRAGNERVVHPRLSDAAFFWEQDCKQSLESRRLALDNVVFEKSLGSLGEKATRVAALAGSLAKDLGEDVASIERAAQLAKTDLLTEMVGEFPELQGRMGYYYALEDGELEAVAKAIDEHYLPRHAGDRLPTTEAGRVLALADRFDTLAGIFAAGKRPTGNKDPFGLRRSALGLVRILIEADIEIDLCDCLSRSVKAQPIKISDEPNLIDELYEFTIDRLKAYCLDGQSPGLDAGDVSPELFESVRRRKPISPRDFHQRLRAVHRFMQMDAAESLAMANKRIANILRSADQPIENEGPSTVDPNLFEHGEEQRLHTAIEAITTVHAKKLAARDYAEVLEGLATLKAPVDDFFDAVMVMADDPAQRQNRLTQLRRLRHFFLDVADLSCIPQS